MQLSVDYTLEPVRPLSELRISALLSRVLAVAVGLLAASLVLSAALFPRTNPDDGYAEFAPRVARATTRLDVGFFAAQAGLEVTCPGGGLDACASAAPGSSVRIVGGYGVIPSPADQFIARLEAWLVSARGDLRDEYGGGAPRMHATYCARPADLPISPLRCAQRVSVLTAIVPTADGPQRQARLLNWIRQDGQWRIYLDFVLPASSALQISEVLSDYCEKCGTGWRLWANNEEP